MKISQANSKRKTCRVEIYKYTSVNHIIYQKQSQKLQKYIKYPKGFNKKHIVMKLSTGYFSFTKDYTTQYCKFRLEELRISLRKKISLIHICTAHS